MKIDCSNCDNRPMRIHTAPCIGGTEQVWKCGLCNCTVRILEVTA